MRKPSTNRDSTFLLGGNTIVALFGIVSQFLILDNLTTFEYGLWVLLLDACLTIGTLADFGIPDAMIRTWDGKKTHINFVVKLGFFSQLLIASVIAVSSFLFSILIGVEDISRLTINMMIIGSLILYLLGSLRIGLRMMGRADEESLALIVDRILYISAVLFVIRFGPTIENLAFAFSVSALASLIYTYWRYYRISNSFDEQVESEPNIVRLDIREMIRGAFPFAISLFLFPLFGRIDKFLIAGLIGVLEVGYFNIPWLVVLTGFAVPRSIRQASLPDMAMNRSKSSNLSNVLGKSWPLIILLMWFGLPSCILLSDFVFEKIFPERLVSPPGVDFSGVRLLVCILPAWVWAMIGSIELEVIKLENNPFKYSGIILISLIFNLVFGYFAINEFGILGAALSSTIGFFSLFLISFLIGPFAIMHRKLAFEKVTLGIYTSSVLFLIAIGWDSEIIASSSNRAAVIISLSNLPFLAWVLLFRIRYLEILGFNIPRRISGGEWQ